MKFGSLFSGIGGFDLGLERAGMQCAWQVEIDPYCNRVLAKHWPGVKRFGDIRQIEWSTVDPVDLLCGGFPCQPHSLAGKRAGSRDERDLWPEFARAIRELKPRWVVVENVRGLLSSEAGRFFGGILRDLAGLGYDAEWQVLSAAAFGAPHIRERVWIVAYPAQQYGTFDGCSSPESGRGSSADVADTQSKRRGEAREDYEHTKKRLACGSAVCNAPGEGLQNGLDQESGRSAKRNPLGQPERSNWWAVEPNVGRVAHGIPHRVDRLRGLMPQFRKWWNGLDGG